MSSTRLKIRLALGLVVATALVYSPTVENRFVNFDDDFYITGVERVQAGLTRESVEWAFTSQQGANWFPLTRLSWLLDVEFSGLDPRAFHRTSLGIHLANSVVLFAALTRMTAAPWASAFAAGVFALHPLHVESVAWAAARKDVVSGLFWMLALWVYAVLAPRGLSPLRQLGLLICVALGLLAKSVLVTLPFVFLLIDEWPLGRLRRSDAPQRWDPVRIRRACAEKSPLLVLVAVFCAITLVAQHTGSAISSLERIPFVDRVENALVSYVSYLRKAFWPVDLSVFYPHPGSGLEARQVAGAAALLAVASGIALVTLRRRPYLAVGWFWFLGTLVPMIGLVQVGQAAMADRYTYLPLIGLSLAFTWSLREIASRWRFLREPIVIACLAALIALGVATSRQVLVWRDSQSLFEHALRHTDRNHVAHVNLGVVYRNSKRYPEAVAHLKAAIAIAPASATAHGVLGEVRTGQGRYDLAEEQFRTALRIEPNTIRWLLGLANAENESGRVDAAIAGLDQVLGLDPEREGVAEKVAGLYVHRAALREDEGRLAEAIADYRAALRLGLRSVRTLNNLAWLLATSDDPDLHVPDEAVALALEAATVSGRSDPSVLDTLATAQLAAGLRHEALETSRETLAIVEASGNKGFAVELRARIAQLETAAEEGERRGS